MQRVSYKTLSLMLILLVAVLAHQNIDCAPCAYGGAIWVLVDPNEPNEPSEPGPESSLWDVQPTWLDVVGDDPNDPNEPDEPAPLPETAGWLPTDDPNDPGPEYV